MYVLDTNVLTALHLGNPKVIDAIVAMMSGWIVMTPIFL
jgi:predicted nucleic acid-binding protein